MFTELSELFNKLHLITSYDFPEAFPLYFKCPCQHCLSIFLWPCFQPSKDWLITEVHSMAWWATDAQLSASLGFCCVVHSWGRCWRALTLNCLNEGEFSWLLKWSAPLLIESQLIFDKEGKRNVLQKGIHPLERVHFTHILASVWVMMLLKRCYRTTAVFLYIWGSLCFLIIHLFLDVRAPCC